MEGKSHTLNKKTIIAIIAIVVLLAIVGVAIGIFLSDRGESSAFEDDQQQEIGNTLPSDDQNQDQEQNSDNNQNQEPNTDNNENNNVDDNTGDNVVNNDAENNNNTEITTGTNVDDVGETTITREEEKVVAKDFWDWWTPVSLAVESTASNIDVEAPNLKVEKEVEYTGTGSSNLVYAGENITYVIKVTNNGTETLKNIEVTDKIPQNTTFVSIDAGSKIEKAETVVDNNNVVGIKWVVTVEPQQTIEVAFTVKVNENVEGTILNAVVANGEESNETHTAIIKNEKSSVIMRDNKEVEIAKIGDQIIYTITAVNTGDINGEILIQDTVPAGTSLVSAEGAKISQENGKTILSWTDVNVPAAQYGGKASVQFIVKVEDIDKEIKNIATVGENPTDENEVPTADIEIVKDVKDIKRNGVSIGNDAEVKAGDVIEYTIKVTNTGSANLTKVVVDEKLDGIVLNKADLQIGDLASGESKTITATYTVTYEDNIKGNIDRTIINNVKVSGETVINPEKPQEPTYVEDEDQEITIVDEMPLVDVEKVATLVNGEEITAETKVAKDDVITYEITVTNLGNTILTNVVVKDELVNFNKTIESLAPGATETYTVAYTVTQNDVDTKATIVNTVVATDGNVTDTDTDETVPTDKTATIDVEKVATLVNGEAITDETKVAKDDVITYEITVTNTGKITLTNIVVTDELVNFSETIESLAPGATKTYPVTYTVTQNDVDTKATIVNTVVATDGNVTDTDTDETVPTDKTATIDVEKVATLVNGEAITDETKVAKDDVITYTITVTNTGKVTLTNVVVTDALVNFSETIESLAPGATQTYPVTYRVTQNDVDTKATIVNTVVATDGNVTDTDTDETVPTDKTATIDVEKVATLVNGEAITDETKVAKDDVITYTITVTNTGKVTLTNVVVTDALVNFNKTIESLAPGATQTYPVTYTVTQNDVDTKATIANTAVATAEDGTTDTDTDETVPTDKTATIDVEKVATLVNGKAITDKTKVAKDDVITYTITVTNTGKVTLTNVVVTDALVNFSKTIESLAPGATQTYPVTYTVTQNDVDTKATITNTVVATADGGITDKDTDNTVVINPNISIPVTKVWANMGSAAAEVYKLDSIKLQVKNGEKVVAEQVVTANEGWTHTFTGLPKYDEQGNEIAYTVAEAAVSTKDQAKLAKYTQSIDQVTKTITNTFDPSTVQDETTEVTIKKVWLDNSDQFKTRPLNVTISVNGVDYVLNATEDTDKSTINEWTITKYLPKYDSNGNLITYKATENTVPTGYTKVSETGTTVTNRADVLVKKNAYKADVNGNIGNETTSSSVFKPGETVYYKLIITNPGDAVVESKTLTDTIPLRLELLSISGTTITTYPQTGADWTVNKDSEDKANISWTVTNLQPGETRELVIKTQVVAEAEYQDLCQKDGEETQYVAELYVRKDGEVPYEGSGTQYEYEDYTDKLGDVYLTSGNLYFDTEANLKNDDLYYLIKNNNEITKMVSKGISRTELENALANNNITLQQDEVVVWYVIKSASGTFHIDGVIRKISDLTAITNEVFMDGEKKDEVTVKLEDIEIGQRGTVTIKGATSSTETVSVPLDVVFVLDTSGSMGDNNKARNMVNAVNSTIKTIMSKNSESRIGVVGFSDDASTIISLDKYSTSKDYLKLGYGYISTNVNSKSREVTGGTNTQSGIKAGAEMLINSRNKTYTTTINGKEETFTRTPLLILVTDGEPTYHYKNETATRPIYGEGYKEDTDENYYYWTIRTAKYYKDKITESYYGETDNTAKVFTIGIGMSGDKATTMLNPNKTNVDNCDENGYSHSIFGSYRNQAGKLYDLLNQEGNPYAYDYADGSKTGELTEEDLKEFLTSSIDSTIQSMEIRAITTQESKDRKIELTDIDVSKEFSLEVGSITYTFETAQTAGYVKGDSTSGYYIDLTNVSRSTNINITYWQK